MTSGVSGVGPILSAWIANNSEPHYRRATSVALGVFAANAVCFRDKYTNHFFYSFFFPLLLGWHFEYLEFSNQGWT